MTEITNTKLIPLTQGKFAIVDAEDYDWLMQWKWCITTNKYAITHLNGKQAYMHKLILKTEKMVDHKNRNTFDNRKENLRLCTPAQNQQNRNIPKDNKTGYKGVLIDKSCTKTLTFRASITHKRKSLHLGSYRCAIEAAKAYDKKALELFGEFALTNKMLGLYE